MTAAAYFYICDGDIDNPVLTHKKMDWPEKYPHWQEIPLVMAQPEQRSVSEHLEPVECDCNQGQSCHVCDPYFPFDSAPQTTRLTQKTTTNDVAIGVDVTEDGTHVTAMRMRPDGINIVIYSQFHPLAQPEQEPVGEVLNERGEVDWISFVPPVGTKLYTTPPQRTWVGLTDEEIDLLWNDHGLDGYTPRTYTEAVEAKLKEKNT